jgi:hypothetical protein
LILYVDAVETMCAGSIGTFRLRDFQSARCDVVVFPPDSRRKSRKGDKLREVEIEGDVGGKLRTTQTTRQTKSRGEPVNLRTVKDPVVGCCKYTAINFAGDGPT